MSDGHYLVTPAPGFVLLEPVIPEATAGDIILPPSAGGLLPPYYRCLSGKDEGRMVILRDEPTAPTVPTYPHFSFGKRNLTIVPEEAIIGYLEFLKAEDE